MNRKFLWKAINDRAVADTGSGGLFGTPPLITGWYWEQGPAGAVMPYVVMTMADDGQEDGFGYQASMVTLYIHIYAPRELSTTAYAGATIAEDIRARIQGDGTPNSPTYGFHRWQTTLPSGSGMVATTFAREGGTSASDLNTVHLIETYSVMLSQE